MLYAHVFSLSLFFTFEMKTLRPVPGGRDSIGTRYIHIQFRISYVFFFFFFLIIGDEKTVNIFPLCGEGRVVVRARGWN